MLRSSGERQYALWLFGCIPIYSITLSPAFSF